jgi:hypothetical protein
MLSGIMDKSGRATAHISATMLTGICLRQTRLEMETDYHVNPLRMFPAFRGTMAHQVVESFPEPGYIYEQRFETELVLRSGKKLCITGQIDKLGITQRHIEDSKTKADAKLKKLSVPEPSHIMQLNIYRWLVYNGWPQKAFTHEGKKYGKKKPSKIEIDTLKLVYFSMNEPKMLRAPVMNLEEVEAYVVQRAEELTQPLLPSIPDGLDPYVSPLCRGWCPVRTACIQADTGF